MIVKNKKNKILMFAIDPNTVHFIILYDLLSVKATLGTAMRGVIF